jgi:DNA-binding transcriptional LysR family regulator
MLETLGQNVKHHLEINASNEFVYSMIKRHVGIAYIHSHYVNENDDIVKLIVSGIDLQKIKLGVIYNKDDSSRLVNTFMTLLRQHFGNIKIS